MEIPGFQTQGSGGSEETHMPGSVQECYHLFFNYMKTQNPDDLAKFNSAAEALREKMPANSEAQKIFDKCLENTGCSTFCPTENFPSDTGALTQVGLTNLWTMGGILASLAFSETGTPHVQPSAFDNTKDFALHTAIFIQSYVGTGTLQGSDLTAALTPIIDHICSFTQEPSQFQNLLLGYLSDGNMTDFKDTIDTVIMAIQNSP